MNQPKVSILMPIYKTAEYLREAMDSILSQTFQDFEFIILDDCSPDNAQEILNTYTDSRIVRYRGDHNVGLANILNIGINMAHGEYIARMDSDDISLPERLQIEVEYLNTHPNIDLVSAGMQMFGAKNQVLLHPEDTEYVKYTAIYYSPILHASSMWRRERFINANLFYRQEMVPAEDYDLWTRALTSKFVLINLHQILYKYRIHSTQATTSLNQHFDKTQTLTNTYIKTAFNLQDQETIDIIKNRHFYLTSWKKWKQYITIFESVNNSTKFINKHWLHKTLIVFFQDTLYSQFLKEGITASIFHLRINQIIKLILYKK